jgi:transcriptional regulator with XRE-family HTH domain
MLNSVQSTFVHRHKGYSMPAKPPHRGKQRTLTGRPIDRLWLDQALERAGTSQRGLAGRVGMDPSALNRTLLGKREWKFEELTAVASALDTELSDLVKAIGGTKHKDWDSLDDALLNRLAPHVVTVDPTTLEVAGEIDMEGNVKMFGHVPDLPFSLRVVGHPLLAGSIYVVDPMSALQGRPWAVVAAADGSFSVRSVQPTMNPYEYNLSTALGFASIEPVLGAKVVDLMPVISTVWKGRDG